MMQGGVLKNNHVTRRLDDQRDSPDGVAAGRDITRCSPDRWVDNSNWYAIVATPTGESWSYRPVIGRISIIDCRSVGRASVAKSVCSTTSVTKRHASD